MPQAARYRASSNERRGRDRNSRTRSVLSRRQSLVSRHSRGTWRICRGPVISSNPLSDLEGFRRNTKHLGANNRQPSLRKKQQFPALADQGPLKERKRCGRLVEKPASKVARCDRCFPLPEPTLPHCHNRSRVFMCAKNASRVEVTGKRENAWFPDYVTNIYIVFRHLATPHGRTSGVKKDRHLRPQHPT